MAIKVKIFRSITRNPTADLAPTDIENNINAFLAPIANNKVRDVLHTAFSSDKDMARTYFVMVVYET